MTPVTYTELRQNLARWMDTAVNDREPILVTRQGAKPVVMMSLEEFEGWMETVHLLASPKNREALMESIAELNAGLGEARDMAEMHALLPPDAKPAG